jgi:hypothetical protein
VTSLQDLGTADKTKTKPTTVVLNSGRCDGLTAYEKGDKVVVPEWEAARMVAAGQARMAGNQ